MPKYCRAPNCSNTAGRLGADNRPVSFYKFPLKDGPRLQAWLRHMGREHWVPSCHQHLCSEHFTPSCFQWRWGVRYLRPDAVPSIFSRAPPAKAQTGLGAVLGALQHRVQRLQRCQERHQAQLQALERLAQQLHGESLLARARRGLQRLTTAQTLGPEESQTFTIICGGPDIAVVLAQDPAPATVDAKPELLDTQTPSA
nr:THAP domain-containing protein 8 isoform X2 [Pongo pygmaeus]